MTLCSGISYLNICSSMPWRAMSVYFLFFIFLFIFYLNLYSLYIVLTAVACVWHGLLFCSRVCSFILTVRSERFDRQNLRVWPDAFILNSQSNCVLTTNFCWLGCCRKNVIRNAFSLGKHAHGKILPPKHFWEQIFGKICLTCCLNQAISPSLFKKKNFWHVCFNIVI